MSDLGNEIEPAQHGPNDIIDLLDILDLEDNDALIESMPNNFAINCCYKEPHAFSTGMNKTHTNDLSFFHVNCRGLSNNWERFKDLIETMHNEYFEFDVIAVSECYSHEHDTRLWLPGYQDILSANRKNEHKGGVALFVKDSIQYKVRTDLSVFIPNVFESLFIEFRFFFKQTFIVGAVYRPNTPPKADVEIFTNTMNELMNIVDNEKKGCVILGDMNIDLLKYETHEATHNYLDQIFAHGFLPVITKPTRISNTSTTLIDHIYFNDIKAKFESGIIVTDVADHYGTYLSLGNCKKSKNSNPIEIRCMNSKATNVFLEHLSNCDFSEIYRCDTADASYDIFIEKYAAVVEKSFPLTIKKNKKKYDPWLTEELLKASRLKTKLYKQKQNNPTPENIERYRIFNNDFNKNKRDAKTMYYDKVLQENKSSMKKTWAILNSALGKKYNNRFPKKIQLHDKVICEDKHIVNIFNEQFINAGKDIKHKIPKVNEIFTQYMPHPIKNSMFIDSVDTHEIRSIINKLKAKSSSGFDNISCKMVKLSTYYIIEPITHIINVSLNTGVVPKNMKVAKVVPIFKKGAPADPNNYRPVSLLPSFSKILERVMFNKIIKFTEIHGILFNHQYGFRAKHSTIHPIIHLLNDCARNYNKSASESTLAIFCDLSKAFDVINHNILFDKLYTYGIRGIALEWLHSYLNDRKQYVNINQHNSDKLDIQCGVPQGSILGPLLFLIYVNDLSYFENTNILSFADDTTIYSSSTCIETLFTESNYQINALYKWFCANELYINASKTNYMIFSPPNIRIDTSRYHISIGDKTIERAGNEMAVKSVKFLGIHIDEHLVWNSHIAYIKAKISKSLFAIRQLRHILPCVNLLNLYNALLHPHLSYGLLVWGNANQTHINKIISIQKKAIRLTSKSSYNSHTEPLFKSANVLNLTDLYKHQVVLFMFDYMKHNLPKSFKNMFIPNRHINRTYNTRQSDLYYVPKCKNKFIACLPLSNYPRMWNELSTKLNTNISRQLFKYSLKQMFLNQYSAVIKCNYWKCEDCNYHQHV